ncbi:MAG: hypothetical protein A4E27_00161 [Methanobacterium sp. PtaU1.Bin242]|nr:MAG: hypothetical protein A4E27_00161 [Methanobacterium sp. PtaU1.Bin242]
MKEEAILKKHDVVPNSLLDMLTKTYIDLVDLKSEKAREEALPLVIRLMRIKILDSNCKSLEVGYGDMDSYLKAISGLPFKNKG